MYGRREALYCKFHPEVLHTAVCKLPLAASRFKTFQAYTDLLKHGFRATETSRFSAVA